MRLTRGLPPNPVGGTGLSVTTIRPKRELELVAGMRKRQETLKDEVVNPIYRSPLLRTARTHQGGTEHRVMVPTSLAYHLNVIISIILWISFYWFNSVNGTIQIPVSVLRHGDLTVVVGFQWTREILNRLKFIISIVKLNVVQPTRSCIGCRCPIALSTAQRQ